MEILFIEACQNLDIVANEEDILEITLNKQYRKMSLLYHPGNT